MEREETMERHDTIGQEGTLIVVEEAEKGKESEKTCNYFRRTSHFSRKIEPV